MREGADLPEAADRLSTSFLEQRLTRAGVELLRSEIAAAGDFGTADELAPPGKPLCPEGVSPREGNCQLPTPEPAPDLPITVPVHTPIEVTGLGTLVHVDHARDLTRLQARLSDPESWLPASAWADRDIKAYVASTYSVCYGGWPSDEPMERSRVLALFPAAPRGLLRGASLTTSAVPQYETIRTLAALRENAFYAVQPSGLTKLEELAMDVWPELPFVETAERLRRYLRSEIARRRASGREARSAPLPGSEADVCRRRVAVRQLDEKLASAVALLR